MSLAVPANGKDNNDNDDGSRVIFKINYLMIQNATALSKPSKACRRE